MHAAPRIPERAVSFLEEPRAPLYSDQIRAEIDRRKQGGAVKDGGFPLLSDYDLARIAEYMIPLHASPTGFLGYEAEATHLSPHPWPLPMCRECRAPIVRCSHPIEFKVREGKDEGT